MAIGRARLKEARHTRLWTGRTSLGCLCRRGSFSSIVMIMGGSTMIGMGMTTRVRAVSESACLAAIFDVPTTFPCRFRVVATQDSSLVPSLSQRFKQKLINGLALAIYVLRKDMHIKSGTWEFSNTVCESDSLCDQPVLVSAHNSEPHIRNRRLSPGSGNCGGGGGGCISGSNQPSRQYFPQKDLIGPGHTHTTNFRKEKERKGQQHKVRSIRRENQKGFSRTCERPQKGHQKEKWVEDSLSLLKPPPAFPVQDSPAKLQPAVSYASKVKARAVSGALEEDRPAIGVLLQNEWGLSFISESRPATEGPVTEDLSPTDAKHPTDPHHNTVQLTEEMPVPTFITPAIPAEVDKGNGDLLLSCRHLVEALNYHNREWNFICNKQKKDPKRVIWYKDTQEHPA
uniref:Uncharacterized protein n=2 Tax=Iconisemion striatum TaxID=60296 RepID=A0A1A7X8F0_9TELE